MKYSFLNDEIVIEICNHCGREVHWGSSWYINRVPDLNDIQTRIDNNLAFPLGDYVCSECDQIEENNFE